jgi:hypothetical protein
MEYLGLHNKPMAEVHTGAIMLTGHGGGEEEEKPSDNSDFFTNVKTNLS